MVIYLSLLIAIVGVLMYALCANPKLVMIGIISYGAGLLAFLMHFTGPALNIVH